MPQRFQVRVRTISLALSIVASFFPSLYGQKNCDTQDWTAYGGGPASIHYSKLAQINRDNVNDLQVV
jgi:quinoprotein glucose dehydrogenase